MLPQIRSFCVLTAIFAALTFACYESTVYAQEKKPETKPAPPRRPPPIISPEVSADGKVTFRVRAPNAKEVSASGEMSNAPVKLVEFSDYQCPFCRDFWQATEGQIIDAYVKTGKVFYTARSAGNWVSGNIGTGDVESQNSAMAAYCAADQNKFWQMHDALFTNVIGEEAGSYTTRRLQAIAQSAGLDMNAFNSCYSSNKYQNQVNQDFQDATTDKITGTPFFVIT